MRAHALLVPEGLASRVAPGKYGNPESFSCWRRNVAIRRAANLDDDWESKTGQKGRRKEADAFQRTPRSASSDT